mmetsp:Transcript_53201/g.126559  ORF Transcript_53201/g.126559 Transcript_53201/m.126559 type:complete len:306 (+) Transcript_53201:435-1352(+)
MHRDGPERVPVADREKRLDNSGARNRAVLELEVVQRDPRVAELPRVVQARLVEPHHGGHIGAAASRALERCEEVRGGVRPGGARARARGDGPLERDEAWAHGGVPVARLLPVDGAVEAVDVEPALVGCAIQAREAVADRQLKVAGRVRRISEVCPRRRNDPLERRSRLLWGPALVKDEVGPQQVRGVCPEFAVESLGVEDYFAPADAGVAQHGANLAAEGDCPVQVHRPKVGAVRDILGVLKGRAEELVRMLVDRSARRGLVRMERKGKFARGHAVDRSSLPRHGMQSVCLLGRHCLLAFARGEE